MLTDRRPRPPGRAAFRGELSVSVRSLRAVTESSERPARAARPGPIYDDAMKILAADDLDAVLSVVGIRVDGAVALNVELAGTRRVDLRGRTPAELVHVEFLKDPSADIDLRMVEYWARIRRREGRALPLRQFVLVLADGITVPDRCAEPEAPGLVWTVVYATDLDPVALLAGPATAALAALARGSDAQRAGVLDAAARRIAREDPDRAAELLQAAATLGSIVLPRSTINETLRGTDMPILIRDTPLGRSLFEEGRQEGRHEGRQAAVLDLTVLLLRQRFGEHPDLEAAATRLAALADEERLAVIAAAASLEDLGT